MDLNTAHAFAEIALLLSGAVIILAAAAVMLAAAVNIFRS